MGCDGGSIPRREELVKVQQKPQKADAVELDRIRWTSCAISKENLKLPVVACSLGFLYNKEVILQRLLEKNMPSAFSHIKSMKDVFPLNIKMNPLFEKEREKLGGSLVVDSGKESPFICPITGVSVGSGHKFVLLKKCGCAFSERVLKQCPSKECLICSTPFTAEDIIFLNPPTEELEKLKDLLVEKKKAEKKQRKEKKESKKAHDTNGETIVKEGKQTMEGEVFETQVTSEPVPDKKRKSDSSSRDEAKKVKEEVKPKISEARPKPQIDVKVPAYANKDVFASIFKTNPSIGPTSFTSTKITEWK